MLGYDELARWKSMEHWFTSVSTLQCNGEFVPNYLLRGNCNSIIHSFRAACLPVYVLSQYGDFIAQQTPDPKRIGTTNFGFSVALPFLEQSIVSRGQVYLEIIGNPCAQNILYYGLGMIYIPVCVWFRSSGVLVLFPCLKSAHVHVAIIVHWILPLEHDSPCQRLIFASRGKEGSALRVCTKHIVVSSKYH